jgi:hypothetical protein
VSFEGSDTLKQVPAAMQEAINTWKMAPKWVLKDAFPRDDHPNFGLSFSL